MRDIPTVCRLWTIAQEFRDSDEVVGTVITKDVPTSPAVMFSKKESEALPAQTTRIHEIVTHPNIVGVPYSHGSSQTDTS